MNPRLIASAVAAVTPLLGRGRVVVGIAGPPAAGKSTLAAGLAAALPAAVAVPMDGFHLAGAELDRLGLADRKGAPETFDGAGFVHLLRRLRTVAPGEVVYAPAFDRGLEEPIGSAIPVAPDVRVVVVEGNYLLVPTPPWAAVRGLLDLALYLDAPAELRYRPLLRRHRDRGLDDQAAHAWVVRSDEANARLVATTRGCADMVLRRD